MRRREPARQIDRDLEHARPGDRFFGLLEAPAAHELGDQVRLLIELSDPIDRDHVRVLDPGRGARLDQETLARLGVGLERGDELDRDLAGEHRVLGEVHVAHLPLPKRL